MDDIQTMLKGIKDDGGRVKYLAARFVIVSWDGEGYSMEVDGEEHGWYSTMKDIVPDIKELQKSEDRILVTNGRNVYVN